MESGAERTKYLDSIQRARAAISDDESDDVRIISNDLDLDVATIIGFELEAADVLTSLVHEKVDFYEAVRVLITYNCTASGLVKYFCGHCASHPQVLAAWINRILAGERTAKSNGGDPLPVYFRTPH